MTKFSVGSRVLCIRGFGDLEEGATFTINSECSYVNTYQVKEIPESWWDADRFEAISACPETKGHSAISGGLRGHSIGMSYPFSVVAGIDEDITTWTVVNYETGETFATFYDCGRAHDYAQALKDAS